VTESAWRKYAKLRTVLFPYLYHAAHQARESGTPVMRHHLLNFPEDTKALNKAYQYMLGDALLVAPVVIHYATDQQVYLPVGLHDSGTPKSWIDFSSHALFDSKDGRWRIGYSSIVQGGQTVSVKAPLDVCPFFVLAGSIIATLDPTIDTLNDAKDTSVISYSQLAYILHLWVWPDEDNSAQGTLYDGASFQLTSASKGISMWKVNDPTYHRIFTAQIISSVAPRSVNITSSGKPLPLVASWQTVSSTDARQTSCWSYDKQQMVLWIRLVSSDVDTVNIQW